LSDINRVVLVGRLTADPVLRHTAGGTAVAEFSVAVNSREKVGGEWQDRADFFDVTAWGNQAEACADHLARGRRVAVEGRLRQERWEKDGQKRSKVKVTATSVQFLEASPDRAEQQMFAPPADDFLPGPSPDDDPDAIPF